MKEFEQQCVLINALLNQGELAPHCSFIGLNGADFNSWCLSNAKHIFYELSSTKNHGQLSFYKEGYQDAVLVSFTATTPNSTTSIHTGEQISSTLSIKRKSFSTELCSWFGVSYRKIRDVGIKRQALKAKDDISFCSSAKCRKGFSKINDTVKSELQKWITSRPHVIPSPMENYHITLTFDDGITGGRDIIHFWSSDLTVSFIFENPLRHFADEQNELSSLAFSACRLIPTSRIFL